VVLGFELRTYILRPFFVMGFFRQGLVKYLPWLALNCNPPHLCYASLFIIIIIIAVLRIESRALCNLGNIAAQENIFM
jgi:hypothetical protein